MSTERPSLLKGDAVRKHSGYPFEGVVRTVYKTGKGHWRVVVECNHKDMQGPEGSLQHIFMPAQLTLLKGKT